VKNYENPSIFARAIKKIEVSRFLWTTVYSNVVWVFTYQPQQQQQRPFNSPLSRTTRMSQYQKGKTNLDVLEQEIVSGSGIIWATCKYAPRPRQITMPTPHQSVFYRLDTLPAAQPRASKYKPATSYQKSFIGTQQPQHQQTLCS